MNEETLDKMKMDEYYDKVEYPEWLENAKAKRNELALKLYKSYSEFRKSMEEVKSYIEDNDDKYFTMFDDYDYKVNNEKMVSLVSFVNDSQDEIFRFQDFIETNAKLAVEDE